MKRLLLLLLALSGLAMQSTPPPEGPYAHRDGWVCYKGETREDVAPGHPKRVHCDCKSRCENDGIEDKTCMTYCTSPKCVCHEDSECGHMEAH